MKAIKYQKKSLIKLEDILRRRKSNLKNFLRERGISTYRDLVATCARMGVSAPSLDFFNQEFPERVSVPEEGIVVVAPLDVIHESTGAREDMEDTFMPIPHEAEDFSTTDSVDTSPELFAAAPPEPQKKRSKRQEVK